MAIDAQRLQVGEEVGDLLDVGFFVDRGVGSDKKTRRLRRLDTFDRFAEHAIALDANIVRLFEAVEVNVEEETRGRLEIAQVLANEHAVGAKVDVLLARENFAGQPANLGINHAARRRRWKRSARRNRRPPSGTLQP